MIVKAGIVALVSAIGLSAAMVFKPVSEEAVPPAPQVARPSSAAMLPARLIDCVLGRITNFDPSKNQVASDYIFEGSHRFRLFLPSIPARTTEPPRSTQPPEPVDPRTRIVADPDKLSGEAADRPFDRVVDYWPDRVEMTTPIGDGAVNLIIVDQFDPAEGVANLFMTAAKDAVTYDEDHLYSGLCKVSTGAEAERASRKPS